MSISSFIYIETHISTKTHTHTHTAQPGTSHIMASSAVTGSTARTVYTRLTQQVKDYALEAAKKSRPQWHLIDAKDQVCIYVCIYIYEKAVLCCKCACVC